MRTSYKNKRLISVTLSTGDVIQIRPMQRADFLQLGDLPLFLKSPEQAKAFDQGDITKKVQDIAEHADYFIKLRNHIFVHCITTPGFKVVVDKALQDCADDEIHIDVIDENDQALILAAAVKVSGVSSGAVAAARPFSGEPAAVGHA